MDIISNTRDSASGQDPYRWVMLSLLTLLYIAFGLVARSIAPLVTPILRDLRLSYSQMGFILGSWQLAYIGVALIAGTLIDRWGIRKSLMAGTLTVGLSVALRYFVQGFEGMLGAVALFGAGGCMISIGVPKTVSLWFTGKSRGTALGISLCGSWVGGILALGLTNSVMMPLTTYSWTMTFLIYGFFTFLAASLWWSLAREGESPKSGEPIGIVQVFANLIGIRNVQIVFITGLLAFVLIHGFSQWLPKILGCGGFRRLWPARRPRFLSSPESLRSCLSPLSFRLGIEGISSPHSPCSISRLSSWSYTSRVSSNSPA